MVEVHYLCASESARLKSRRCVFTRARALLVSALIIVAPHVAAAQMLSGSYTGDGADNRAITELGFQPDVVIIKGNTAQIGVIRTSTMTGDAAKPMTGATGLTANLIQSLDTTGFTIGWDPLVNSSGVEYYWVAFRAVAGKMKLGTYTGNGAVGRAITGVGFPGDIVFVMSASTARPVAVTSTSLAAGENGLDFFTTSAGGWFTSIDTDGFTLNSAVAENNANTIVYHYIVWNQVEGQIRQGTYVGNGADNRNITGVGFEPEYVITFSSNGQEANHHPASLGAAVDDSMFFTGLANLNNRIQALQADGFQVGSDFDVNRNNQGHFYIAWTRIQGPPQVLSGSYTGDGTDNRAITGLGFRPDFVIVKGDTAQDGVFRSSRMDGDVSKPAVGAVAVAANLVQSLNADGFTIGTDVRVNSSGLTYHWIAFSAGAGVMVVNTYTGNGAASRSFTGLGFQPELVWIMPAGANEAVWRPSTDASTYNFFDGGPTALITALGVDGFTVNSDARVNANGAYYYYVAWNEIAGEMDVGSYTGDANDDRNITGLGFQPEYVFVKRTLAGYSVLHHPDSIGSSVDSTLFFDARGAFSNYIQALQVDGFQIGNQVNINASGGTYRYAAWKGATLTAVRMSTTDATRTRDGVKVTWRTGYEIDNIGFHVHREIDGERTRVTGQMIAGSALSVAPGVALTGGRSYSWNDESPEALQRSVRYWIEDIDLNGTRTWHGPIVPSVPKTGKSPTGGETQPRDGMPRHRASGESQTADTIPAETVTPNSPLLQELTLAASEPQDPVVTAAPADVSAQTPAVAPIFVAGSAVYAGARPAASPRGTVMAARPAVGPWPVRPRTTTTPLSAAASTAVSASAAAPVAGQPSSSSTTVTSSVSGRTALPAVAPALPLALQISSSPAAEGLQSSSSATVPTPNPIAPRSLRIGRLSGGPASATPAAIQEQWNVAAQGGTRIDIRSAGWYRFTQPVLVAAGLSAAVDPRNLRLVVDGVERPMIVTGASDGTFDAADTLEFYATGVDTPFTDRRAYWITAGVSPGLRLTQVDARTAGTPAGASFAHTAERKDRQIFFGGLQNGDEENFFGPLIMGADAPDVPILTEQQLALPNVADLPASDARLEVSLQGVTVLPAANDHRVGVLVNGTEVGELVFDGRTVAVAVFSVSHALLTSGLNTVAFEARNGIDDMSLVESVRLTYQRAYRADGNQLTLNADGGQELTITGFTDAAVRVFDVTGDVASGELIGTVAADAGVWSTRFTVPGGAPRKLFVATPDAIGTPAAVQADVPSTLHNAGQAGDIVMITHASFASALTPLRNLRQSQGHSVQVIDVQDVYDEFAFGQKTPAAIRDFLVRASEYWAKPPRFVLLVGNGTADPRNYQGVGDLDFVPTRIVPTGALETASDDWFVDSDSDSFADLASVGRLPARTLAELSTMVDKIVAYEQSSSETWHQTVLLVSDDGRDDFGAGDVDAFAALSGQVGAIVPPGYQVQHLRRDQDPSAAQTLRTKLSDGALLVNYQGHGSVETWRGDLLTTGDIATLDNGSRLPLVVAMTCFGGAFHDVYSESLAAALLRTSNGGAVGVWASSGMTDSRWQASMDRELFRQVFRGNWTSIGEAMRAAKKVVGDPDVRRTWVFLGDPAMRLKGVSNPPVQTEPTVTPVPAPPAPDDEESSDEQQGQNRRPAHVSVRLADFDGDRVADAFIAEPLTGSWFAALGVPGAFRYSPGQFSIPGEPIALNLNNDGRDDLFVYNAENGAWLQALSLGDGTFLTSTSAWPAGLRVLPGDFDGNGGDDVLGYHPSGMWFQALSDGNGGFSYRYRYGLQSGDAYVADFNADGRADVFVYNPATGQWTMAFSTDGDPNITTGTWTTGWQPIVANLNGDGAADVMLWHAESGTWVQCIRDAAQFFAYGSGTWPSGGRILAADLNGDGRDEVLRYDWRTGEWTLASLNLAGIMTQWDGLWEIGWELTPGDLNGDGRQDLLLYNPDTGEWIRRLNLPAGWTDDASGLWSRNWTVAGRRR